MYSPAPLTPKSVDTRFERGLRIPMDDAYATTQPHTNLFPPVQHEFHKQPRTLDPLFSQREMEEHEYPFDLFPDLQDINVEEEFPALDEF